MHEKKLWLQKLINAITEAKQHEKEIESNKTAGKIFSHLPCFKIIQNIYLYQLVSIFDNILIMTF